MKKLIATKLTVNRETVKLLEKDTLLQVVGGRTSPCPIGTAKVDCG